MCSLAGKGPVEDSGANFLALNQAVRLEAVDDLLDGWEGNACLDGKLLNFLVVEHRTLSQT